MYSELKEGILMAAKHGEVLLFSIRGKSQASTKEICSNNLNNSDTIGNVFAVERSVILLDFYIFILKKKLQVTCAVGRN